MPPNETTRVSARRVVVLAPHFDDEVFGCGGLLAQLADSGADTRVLYLTDSSGGDEVRDNREAYSARRRREAQRGLEILGVGGLEALAVPDGSLTDYIDRAAKAIRRTIREHHPDLLLSVSACEITRDHQAAFEALHRALSPLRGGTELDEIMAGCRILLYEVNHPGYPDVLVDVSSELDRIERAIDAHVSQLELHNYREAALGMRHYRALSLTADVRAAEAFREITLSDLVTVGHASLVRRLGGFHRGPELDDGPLVSVIVRTKNRPELLEQALASIAASTYRRVEIVLVNDGGVKPEVPESIPFPVVRVELATNSGRSGAANAGVEAASGDYVAFLDDDDLMEPEHLETLVGLVSAADVRVAYTDAAVGIYELDPDDGWREVERRLPYSRDFDPDLLLLDNYIPFNTLLIERSLVDEAGPFADDLEFFEDWDFLIRLAALAPFHHLAKVTAEYRHFRGAGHHVLGERARERSDFLRVKAAVIDRHRNRLGTEVIARVVDRLRSETVAQIEEATRLGLAHVELSDSYHRLNGELASLRGDHSRVLAENQRLRGEISRVENEFADQRRSTRDLESEVRRLHGDETRLRATVADQDAHLARVYAEIERLTQLIGAMERTTAWRLHKTIDKLRGRSS